MIVSSRKRKKYGLDIIITFIFMILFVISIKPDIVKAEEYDGTLGSVLNVDGGTLNFIDYSGWTGAKLDDRVFAKINGYVAGYKAYFTTTVTGPKVLSFDWFKTHSNLNSSTLQLLVDDVFMTQLVETNSWVTQIVEIPPGVHTIKWYYYVNSIDTKNPLYNAAYVDNVKIMQPLYTVTFHENHTSNSKITTASVFTVGDVVAFPMEPTRSGYVFLGWNTKADGTGEAFTTATKVVKSQTVYAHWGSSGSTSLPKVATTLKVKADKTAKLEVTNADNATITYQSANESIAKVDANGRVSGIYGGTTTITTTITTSYGKVLVYKTTVTVTPTLKISKTNATIYVRKTLKLAVTGTDDAIEWVSDDVNVATVTSKGVVTGKAKGTATIYAYVNGEEFSCDIVVKAYTNSAKAKNAYISFLNSSVSDKYFSNYFALIDIDRDGTEELILGDSDPWYKDYYATWQVFTFYKNKVTYIGQIRGEGLGYSETKRTLISCTSSSSSSVSENVYKKSKNKLTRIHSFYDGNSLKKIDGKKKSAAYFKKIYNKYVANETSQVVFFENNEENRTEYLQ